MHAPQDGGGPAVVPKAAPRPGPEEPDAAGEPAVGEVTRTSDDSTATSPPRVRRRHPRRPALQPAGLVESGYRVRLNGVAPLGLRVPQDDEVLAFQLPAGEVAQPGPTTVTVEALPGTRMPQALWRFQLDDPAGPPA